MSHTQKIELRAQHIVSYLVGVGRPVTIDELCADLSIEDGSTTRRAMKRARELAEARGLFFPAAVPGNGFSYCVTDDPSDIVASKLHCSAQEAGTRTLRRKHDAAIEQRKDRLDPVERAEYEGLTLIESKADTVRDALDDLLRTAVSQQIANRRRARAEGVDA